MKNLDIITLANLGIQGITNHSLNVEAAYKVYKFKKIFKEKYGELATALQDLLKEVGVYDAKAFDDRKAELLDKPERTEEEQEELKVAIATADKYLGLRAQLMQEDASFEGVKPLSWAEWKTLQDENHTGGKDLLVGLSEELLEGVLWEDPNW